MAALDAASARLKEKEKLQAKMRDANPPQDEPPAPNFRSGVFAKREA
jgi:hypothetical protein